MKKMSVKWITINAIVAAAYAAMTILIYPLSYGQIQMRISEVMVFLAFYNKKYIPGLVVGCLIANIPSSLGMIDMVFGTFSTLLVVLAMYYIKNRYVAAIAGGLITGVIIGAELVYAFQLPFLINMFYVFAGEVIILLIGAFVFGIIEKNQQFMNKFLIEE